MQIYEVFQANENVLKGVANSVKSAVRQSPAIAGAVNSVKSAVSRAPAIAGAVANDIGSRILSRAGLPGDVGMGSTNVFGDKEAQAAKTAEPLIKVQADNLFKQWAANKDRGNPAALQQSLINVVQNTLLQKKLGRDYTSLDNWVAQDPQTQQRAAGLVKNITKNIDDILKSDPQDTAQSWENLVRATSQAMSLMTFHPKNYNYTSTAQMPTIIPTAQGYNIGQTALNTTNPAQQQMIQLIKSQTAPNGAPPRITTTPQGYVLGSTLLTPSNATHKKLIDIISGGAPKKTKVKTKKAKPAAKPPAPAPTTAVPVGDIKGANAGAPTSAEYANFDQKVQQAMAAQGQTA